MKSSINIGRLLGITIEISYTWFIIFGLITWTLAVNYFPVYNSSLSLIQYWGAAIVSSLLLFASLLAHELSHSYVANKNNLPIKKITLFIFGGVAHMTKEPDTPLIEFKMSIAGPICSLFIALASYLTAQGLTASINPNSISILIFNYIALINTAIVVFNLIPGFPLDGGRILRAIIWQINKNLKSATRIATSIGKGFAFLFMFIGLSFLFKMLFINGIWFLVIGIFLHEAAEMSYQQLILKKALVGISIKEIMVRDIISVPHTITLDTLVNEYFLKHRYMGFPVVDGKTLKGMITLQGIKEIPKIDWPRTLVSDAMTKVRDDLIISPEHDALEALLQVTKIGLGRLLVVDSGNLIGIIGQRDLLHLFEIKTHLI